MIRNASNVVYRFVYTFDDLSCISTLPAPGGASSTSAEDSSSVRRTSGSIASIGSPDESMLLLGVLLGTSLESDEPHCT
jgi:hypothetical protein